MARFEALAPHVLPSLRAMHSLEALWVKSALLDQKTFTHLKALSSLTSLAWEADWGGVWFAPRAVTHTRGFARLRQLSISIEHGSGPLLLLRCIDSLFLRDVNIYLEYLYMEPGTAGHCLQMLFREAEKFHSPERITVVLGEAQERRINISDATPAAFVHQLNGDVQCILLQPILSITTLRVLEVGINVVFEVAPESLLELADKLPHLESLRLTPSLRGGFAFARDKDPEARFHIPDLATLALFSQRCTNLVKLSLAVQGLLFTDAHRWAAEMVHSRSARIRTLKLWTTAPAGDTPDEDFVQFFVDSFPALEELCVVLPFRPADPLSREPIAREKACSRWECVARGVTLSKSTGMGEDCAMGSVEWRVV
ncbi:hypothetical protein C2E23DRAFT_860965 [Lenzites betulinus]|nr:hypothetical protein C2E23DRAFT_860965 [Lenzites betulinus]